MFRTSELMAAHGMKAVFSDRDGGCSSPPFDSLNLGFDLGDAIRHVEQNLSTLCENSGLPTLPHQARQVHGTQILHCHGDGRYHHVDADILITDAVNTPVAIRTADCLPILLADPRAKVIAAVHAGWKGTVAKVAQVAVREMCHLGASPESIIASLGSCIGPCCFEVNADIARKLGDSCGKDVSVTIDGKLHADLLEANMAQLLDAGVSEQHIENLSTCTVCQSVPTHFS